MEINMAAYAVSQIRRKLFERKYNKGVSLPRGIL